jgi:8-oxo-dGTP diphosphatase
MLPTDRWTICEEGHVHWGADGAAGLLLRHVPLNGEPLYLLQERSRWVDHPRTWGIPGGAIRPGESPEVTARREAEEEIGPVFSCRVTGTDTQDCGGGWKFHTITADVDSPFQSFCVRETDATGWFTREEMRQLSLHPGFRRWLEEH